MDPALRALNRFGLGARVGEREALHDPRGWLRRQLRPAAAILDDGRLPDAEAIGEAVEVLRRAQRAKDPESIRDARRHVQEIRAAETSAAVERRVTTDTPLLERLVAFWSNHLCVSAAKGAVGPLAGLYEREVVRPQVLGRFTDMVLASARHPAMLLYLDNVQSIGPDSPAARAARRRAGRERGLNENYARELMELHTVGVDGGYTQEDVVAMARILTGWSVEGLGPATGRRAAGGFRFRPAFHEPGPKTVMGRTYREAGEREGEGAIRDLCAHPATARFVSSKLVRHFVADDPPPRAVDRVATVFAESGGDLKAVSLALIDLDEAWSPASRKLRTPQDWLVALLRAVRVREVELPVAPVLVPLRHPMWAPDAPKGFGDRTRDWADPDALMNRAELARKVAGRVARSGMEPTRLLDVIDVDAADPLGRMLADGSVPAAERVALAFGGPAFQWR